MSQPQRRPWRRRLFLLFTLIVVVCAGVKWHRYQSLSTAEASALDYVRLHGYTGEGYRHNIVSALLSFIPHGSGRPIASQAVPTVSFPRDRMNNYMAQELLQLRNLEGIILYPPDPRQRGIDTTGKTFTTTNSLRDLGLPLSDANIVALEKKFPRLVIHVAQQSTAQPGADAQGDVTK